MKQFSILPLALIMVIFSGCQPEVIILDCPPREGPDRSILSIDKTAIAASAAADTYQLQVTATQAWEAGVDAEAAWCVVSPAHYAGKRAVTVSVAENFVIEPRSTTITFTSGMLTQTVAVTQEASAPRLVVAPVAINAMVGGAAYPIAVASNTDWTARVDGDAAWCTLSGATGKGDGTFMVNVGVNSSAATRSATVIVSADTVVRVMSVVQSDLYAASPQTWAFGNQTWSDAIHMPACNKESFVSTYNTAQCRSYTGGGKTFYYYNWRYVSQTADTLCTSPWRMPTQTDFNMLITNLGGNTKEARETVTAAWDYGGYVNGNYMLELDSEANYWSSTPSNAFHLSRVTGSMFVFERQGFVGLRVRCVKN